MGFFDSFGSITEKIGSVFHSFKEKVSDNDTLILTGFSCLGVFATGILAFKAGPEVRDACNECNADIDDILRDDLPSEEARQMIDDCKRKRNRRVAKAVAGPIITGAATIGCDILREKKWSDKFKDLALLYALNQKKFEEFKDKTKEIVGPGKAEKIDDEIIRDHARENRIGSSLIPYNTGGGISYFQIENSGQLLIASEQWFYERFKAFNDTIENLGPGAELTGEDLFRNYLDIPAPDTAYQLIFDRKHKAHYRIIADRDTINGVETTFNIIEILGSRYPQYHDSDI